jgi:hypothetical protein
LSVHVCASQVEHFKVQVADDFDEIDPFLVDRFLFVFGEKAVRQTKKKEDKQQIHQLYMYTYRHS